LNNKNHQKGDEKMKRKTFITILATLMLLVLAVSAFTACGKKDGDKDKGTTHIHTYATEWSNDETNHWHAATCEHTSEKKDNAAHTFGEWTETKAPTYTEKGEKQRACTVCSYVDKQEVDVLVAKENGVTFNISPRTYDKTEQGCFSRKRIYRKLPEIHNGGTTKSTGESQKRIV